MEKASIVQRENGSQPRISYLAKPSTREGRRMLQTCAVSEDLHSKCFLRKLLEMCSTEVGEACKKEENKIQTTKDAEKKSEMN